MAGWEYVWTLADAGEYPQRHVDRIRGFLSDWMNPTNEFYRPWLTRARFESDDCGRMVLAVLLLSREQWTARRNARRIAAQASRLLHQELPDPEVSRPARGSTPIRPWHQCSCHGPHQKTGQEEQAVSPDVENEVPGALGAGQEAEHEGRPGDQEDTCDDPQYSHDS